MEYKVVVAKFSADLAKRVNESIAEGWLPQGGVSMCEVDDDDSELQRYQNEPQKALMFSQAMIRVEKKN
jgi:hypothetical protein